MKQRNIGIGIEIECVYNTKIRHVDKGDYHNGIKVKGLNGWNAESDGSIGCRGSYDCFGNGWTEAIELISKYTKSEDKFFEYLENFAKFFSENGKYELKDVLRFNNSCGHHVHFSVDKKFLFEDKIMFEVYLRVRDKFFELINKSKIHNKVDILKHYNRNMAKLINEDGYWKNDRYSEFNLESERENKGLEWRSVNMLGITTWSEFFEFWEIVYKCLEYFYDLTQKYQVIKKYGYDALNDGLNKFKDFELIEIKMPKKKHRRTIRVSINPHHEVYNDNVEIVTRRLD